MSETKPTLDHPAFGSVKRALAGTRLRGTEFRGQSTLIVEPGDLHRVMAHLKSAGDGTDTGRGYDFLTDITAVDYLNYPTPTIGRFGVVYLLARTTDDDRFTVKTFLDPSLPTEGTAEDPALWVDSVTDLWAGAEWMEREVYDMFGIRFRHHPDLRRILTWETFPGHPLRKDYPLRGRGEREMYKIVDRGSA